MRKLGRLLQSTYILNVKYIITNIECLLFSNEPFIISSHLELFTCVEVLLHNFILKAIPKYI